MATMQKVLTSMMKYASFSGIFQTPTAPSDSIDPPLSGFKEEPLLKIHSDLHTSLLRDGINTFVGLQKMLGAKTWQRLARLAYDNQKA